MQKYFWPVLLPILFLAYSLPLFLRVYATAPNVIDEEFHLRQGLHFCNKRFDVWDPKITTFPGLYLFSLILIPLNACTELGLRCISLAAATVNVVTLYKIRRRLLGSAHGQLAALDAITLGTLPPLYFFSHLYYTDTLSLTTVLLFYYYWHKESHLQAAVFGATSVLVRQTNVVWVAMCFAIMALDVMSGNYARVKGIKKQQVELLNPKVLWDMLTSYRLLGRSIWQILRKGCYYLIIILPFVFFVFLNGSIVIGDKRAHEATMHLPQIFYFSLFAAFFGVSNTMHEWQSTLRWLSREKLIVLFLLGVGVLTVKWNTLVHPYLLADNRHYTFYIWNRFYGRYLWFKYAMVPVYVFALALLHCGLRHMRTSFKLMFWIATLLVLCFQRLLEPRYFIIPFVLYRLHTQPLAKSRWAEWLELASYVGINALTFFIFFTKEITWMDFKEPQRIIW
ncbi:putative Dol-P-Glc:Glc(2)Man(9)GlcNAc(2)-PP-Dol alpha-1,2-glucosyltransferase [Rhagoletis pomonella]|uniref:putative Dol-P-Glc:Glc(2)Man(9)GlcNAc(2)-PP-Dol alpha-1,2-glucosyltransferase n=1 Tax=Rhagoletis pomonella TaxID=28610 RepID=UPI00177C8F44|nr:putative Dol-P-Glc:Glc(2)Man(9)GlcNAc(2)-PP-Dol alpha-1,2-glucosyltransferase [Rhagoletis pomonella]